MYSRKISRSQNVPPDSDPLLVLAKAASNEALPHTPSPAPSHAPTPAEARDSEADSETEIRRARRPNLLNLRTSPKGLFDLVRDLSDGQKQSIRDIGFGSMLSLSVSRCPLELSLYLLKNFQASTSMFTLSSGERLSIDEEDVHCVLNLPRGEVEIVESIGKNEDSEPPEYVELLRAWRRRWVGLPNKGAPSTASMPDIIKQNTSAYDNFKRDFVVYVVSSFLSTNQNKACRYLLTLWDYTVMSCVLYCDVLCLTL